MASRPTRIVILGNSVALLVSPFRKTRDDKTYGELLEERGFEVLNNAKQAVVVSDLYRYMEDECTRRAPDVVVMNFGIVECTYRARSRRLQKAFAPNAWKNNIISQRAIGMSGRLARRVLRKVYGILERVLFFLHIKWRWVTEKRYRFILRDIIKVLFRDTNAAAVILLPILKGESWLEREAPGTLTSIGRYNEIMNEIACQTEGVRFIAPQEVYASRSDKEISDDGIHLTPQGHARVAELIAEKCAEPPRGSLSWQSINLYGRTLSSYAHRNRR